MLNVENWKLPAKSGPASGLASPLDTAIGTIKIAA